MLQVPLLGASEPRERFSFCRSAELLPILPIRGGVDRLSRQRARACKFCAHMNYAVTQVSATGFEPETVHLRIQLTCQYKLLLHLPSFSRNCFNIKLLKFS